jgi:prolipoprotein diacylglyceryltransferase
MCLGRHPFSMAIKRATMQSLGMLGMVFGTIVLAYGYMRSMVEHFDAQGLSYWGFETDPWFIVGVLMVLSGGVLLVAGKMTKVDS